jgi:hypothetical protein
LVFLITLFYSMGITKPSVTFNDKLTIDKPLEEIWTIAKEEFITNQCKWFGEPKSIDLIEGEMDRPNSKYKIIIEEKEGQKETEVIQTLISIKEFEQMEVHYEGKYTSFEHFMNSSDSGGQTMITVESKVIGNSLTMRSLIAMLEAVADSSSSFAALGRKNLATLKETIEKK